MNFDEIENLLLIASALAERKVKTSCLRVHSSNIFLQVLFGAAAVSVTEKYAAEVNFTYPISVQSYSMLISRPKELSRLYLFTAPFTIDVNISFLPLPRCWVVQNNCTILSSLMADMVVLIIHHCDDWSPFVRRQLPKSVQ